MLVSVSLSSSILMTTSHSSQCGPLLTPDTNLLVGQNWVKRAEQGYIPKAFVEPQGTLIQDLVAQGKLGRKSGHGFYSYEGGSKKSLK